MKRKSFGIILCFAFLISAFLGVKALSVAPEKVMAEDTNLLQNGSFDKSIAAWNWNWSANTSVFSYEYSGDSHANDGTGSLKITNTEVVPSCVGQTVAMEANVTYIISAYIKIDSMVTSGAGGTGAMVVIESHGFSMGNTSTSASNTGWVYYEGAFTPETAGNYRIDCRLWAAKGTIYFDDLRVETRSNFISDPTFSSLAAWKSGWSNGGANTTVEWSSLSRFADGTGSMHIVNAVSAATQQGQAISVPLEVGKKYVVSGYIKVIWLKPNNAGGCGAYLSFGDEYGLGLGRQTTSEITSETPWVYYETDYTPKETGTYTLFCRIWGSAGEAYFDNISIKEYKEQTSGGDAVLPTPDTTITPVAIRAIRKTGIYVALDSLPVAAAPKGSALVADAELTSGGNEYYRIIYADDGVFGKVGYVLKSLVEIDEAATVYKVPAGTGIASTAGGAVQSAVQTETYVAAFSSSVSGYVEVYADVQSIVRSYIAKNEITEQPLSSLVQTFGLTVTVNGTGGVVGGIAGGTTVYPRGKVVYFSATPSEGYICTITCDGGILTKGQENYALTMTEEVTLTIDFKAKLNRELYPLTSFPAEGNYKFDYTWISGTTYYYGVADSATADGSGSLLVNNVTASHTTLNYVVELTACTTYVLKAKVKGSYTNPGTAGGCGLFVMVENCINLGGQISGTREITEWTELSGEFTPTTTGRYSVNLRLWGCSGTVYFDEVSLVPVSQTTFTHTYAVGGIGGRITEKSVSGSHGDSVTVMAVPNPGYEFVGWTDGVTTPFRTDVIVANATFTAKFKALPSCTVSYKAGEGGIVAGKTATVVNKGTYRTMVAIPNEGYIFTGWSDGVKTAMRTDYITQSLSVTANFAKVKTVKTVAASASAPVAESATPVAPTLPDAPSSGGAANALLPKWLSAKKED